MKWKEVLKAHCGTAQKTDEKMLYGGQKKLDKDKDGRITGKDFAMLRREKKRNVLKADIAGLKRSYPSLKGLPDDAIREFDRRLSPHMSASRLIAELRQKFGVTRRMPTGRFAKEDIEEEILEEVEDEGGALGMKNLKDIADKKKLKETLSSMEDRKIIFEHEDGDFYTHKPKREQKKKGD
jgi:hypothetical protein